MSRCISVITEAEMRHEIRSSVPHVYQDDAAEALRSRAWGLAAGAWLMMRQAHELMAQARKLEDERKEFL
ncbi:hypothetical protein [Xanthobacter autotrophicus]|uniref:hypothetical protein n=1 Tax=Xanthobacter autotrophicus TaxID=280 RepID=UPI00372B765E